VRSLYGPAAVNWEFLSLCHCFKKWEGDRGDDHESEDLPEN